MNRSSFHVHRFSLNHNHLNEISQTVTEKLLLEEMYTNRLLFSLVLYSWRPDTDRTNNIVSMVY